MERKRSGHLHSSKLGGLTERNMDLRCMPLRSVALIALLLLAVGHATIGCQPNDPDSITAVTEKLTPGLASTMTGPMLFERASAAGLGIEDDPTVIRYRPVSINIELLGGESGTGDVSPRIRFNLFEDVQFIGVLDDYSATRSGHAWVGHPEGIERSRIALINVNGVVTGTITLSDAKYRIEYLEGSVHAIIEIDESSFPPEEPPQE